MKSGPDCSRMKFDFLFHLLYKTVLYNDFIYGDSLGHSEQKSNGTLREPTMETVFMIINKGGDF